MPKETKKTPNGVLAVVRNLGQQKTSDLKQVIAEATAEELKAELARLLGFSAENLTRLAIITQELESRGEDLSAIRFGLLPLLRQIACGTLLPEIVVKFAGEPDAIRKISRLCIAEQRQIACGEKDFVLYTLPAPRELPPLPPVHSSSRVPVKSEDRELDNLDPASFDEREEDVAQRCARLSDEEANGQAAFHAKMLLLLLKAGKNLSMPHVETALLELGKILGDRIGKVSPDALRYDVAKYLADHGRSPLKAIAKATGVADFVLAPILAHPWFKEVDSYYGLTTEGRRAAD
jgi:hypothetical protein